MLESVLATIAVVLFIALMAIIIKYSALKATFHSQLSRMIAEERVRMLREAQMKLEEERKKMLDDLQKMFEDWKRSELEGAVKVEFEKWRQQAEKEIRRDAILGSVRTILGKVSEHIAPLYMMGALGLDPRDLRFIGTPVDFIAFKGLSEGNPEKILFIEVKASQTGALTERERMVRRLVEGRQVEWVTFHVRREIERAVQIAEKEVMSLEGLAGNSSVMEEDQGLKGAIPLKSGAEKEIPVNRSITHITEDKEFYAWLMSEWGISKEQFEELEGDLKQYLRDEFQKKITSKSNQTRF